MTHASTDKCSQSLSHPPSPTTPPHIVAMTEGDYWDNSALLIFILREMIRGHLGCQLSEKACWPETIQRFTGFTFCQDKLGQE